MHESSVSLALNSALHATLRLSGLDSLKGTVTRLNKMTHTSCYCVIRHTSVATTASLHHHLHAVHERVYLCGHAPVLQLLLLLPSPSAGQLLHCMPAWVSCGVPGRGKGSQSW